MNGIKIETKTNGYKAEGLQEMISKFEKVAAKLFPGCRVSHFYYGDYLDMADIGGVGNCSYCHFNIRENRVSINGYCADNDDIMKQFESMTYNDELYNGKLLELAESI